METFHALRYADFWKAVLVSAKCFVSCCCRFVMCFFVIVYQVQVSRLKDQVQKLNDEKEDIQLRESKLNQENARYTLLIHTCSTFFMSSTPFVRETVADTRKCVAPSAYLSICCC